MTFGHPRPRLPPLSTSTALPLPLPLLLLLSVSRGADMARGTPLKKFTTYGDVLPRLKGETFAF